MKDQAFYSVTAQVIPVLFLALVLEQRVFAKRKQDDPEGSLFLLAIVALAAVGELISLSALTDDARTPTDIERDAVLFAITVLFLPLLVQAAAPQIQAIAEGIPWIRRVGRAGLVAFLVAITVLAITNTDPGPYLAGGVIVFYVGVAAVPVITDLYATRNPRGAKKRKKKPSKAR